MGQKPPAFQFYVKDWISSHLVNQMNMHERGIYITLLAAAWDSDEPGTLPLPVEIAARSARLDPRCLRNFLSKFPRSWREIGSKLVNEKLHQQWLSLSQFQQNASDKGKKGAAARWSSTMPEAMPGDGSASAFAFASANQKKEQPQTPNPPSLSLDQIKTQLKTVGAMPRYAMSERAINDERNRQREALKAKHPRLFA